MNTSLVIDQLSISEQRELLRALLDRLYPENLDHPGASFPDWVMNSLEDQDQLYREGLETGDDVDTVDTRIRQKMIRS